MSRSLAFVFASYRVGVSARSWLEGVAASAAALLDRGLGVVAWMRESGSPELWEAHAGSPLDASATVLLAQVGAAFMHGVRRAGVDTLRNHHAMHDARLAHALQGLMAVGIEDLALIMVTHPDGAALVIGSPLATARNLTQRERRQGELLAGHLACGLRLRAREARRPRPYPAGAGQPSEDLSSDMRAAALAADAANADVHEGEAAWVSMLQGRWVGEHGFDEDGRRYVIAREVPVGAEARAGLSARQQRVLALRHKGYPLKKIASEIGRSVSTASAELQRAVKALGVRGVNDLGGAPVLEMVAISRLPAPPRESLRAAGAFPADVR